MLESWEPAAAVAGFLLFWTWESVSPFSLVERRGRHAVRNLSVAGLNALLTALVLAAGTVAAAAYSEQSGFGLLHRAGLSGAARFALAFLALDLWSYWWHRLNHTVPLLWRFHRMHHSDPTMDVSTATRFHTGEIALGFGLRMGVILLAGVPLAAVAVFDAALVFTTQFHHSNIVLPARFDRWLRFAIVSPNMHKVHHSVEREEMDSNYTSVLSVWDRVFGTYRGRDDCREIVFGVPGMRDEGHQSIAGMLRTPFDSMRRGVGS